MLETPTSYTTIPRAKQSDSFVGRGLRSSNLLGSRSSGLIHGRVPPAVNVGREAVELVPPPVKGPSLAMVDMEKPAIHAR